MFSPVLRSDAVTSIRHPLGHAIQVMVFLSTDFLQIQLELAGIICAHEDSGGYSEPFPSQEVSKNYTS